MLYCSALTCARAHSPCLAAQSKNMSITTDTKGKKRRASTDAAASSADADAGGAAQAPAAKKAKKDLSKDKKSEKKADKDARPRHLRAPFAGRCVSFDAIIRLLAARGVRAGDNQTGGGCAIIECEPCAGMGGAGGGRNVCIGPGWFAGAGWTDAWGDTADLSIEIAEAEPDHDADGDADGDESMDGTAGHAAHAQAAGLSAAGAALQTLRVQVPEGATAEQVNRETEVSPGTPSFF